MVAFFFSFFAFWAKSRNHFFFTIIAGESNKLIADYRYKLQKAEQEIASLNSNLARSETHVCRYKSAADESEKAEAELKIERRKLQREVSSTNSATFMISSEFFRHLFSAFDCSYLGWMSFAVSGVWPPLYFVIFYY